METCAHCTAKTSSFCIGCRAFFCMSGGKTKSKSKSKKDSSKKGRDPGMYFLDTIGKDRKPRKMHFIKSCFHQCHKEAYATSQKQSSTSISLPSKLIQSFQKECNGNFYLQKAIQEASQQSIQEAIQELVSQLLNNTRTLCTEIEEEDKDNELESDDEDDESQSEEDDEPQSEDDQDDNK